MKKGRISPPPPPSIEVCCQKYSNINAHINIYISLLMLILFFLKLLGGGGRDGGMLASQNDEETMRITPRTIILFVCISCTMLIALYFLYKYLFYIILAIFCLVSSIGTQRILDLLFACMPFPLPALPLRVPFFGRVTFWSILSTVIAISLAVSWAVFRKDEGAWIAQDILSICFLLSTIQFIRLPSLKVLMSVHPSIHPSIHPSTLPNKHTIYVSSIYLLTVYPLVNMLSLIASMCLHLFVWVHEGDVIFYLFIISWGACSASFFMNTHLLVNFSVF